MQSMTQNFVYLHSYLRYFLLLFAVIVVIQSLLGMMGNRKFKPVNKQMALALLIFCDLQLLIGGYLYYARVIATGMLSSPGVMKDPASRFWAVEHSTSMVIALILVHVGFAVTKKNMDDDRKFKKLFWCSFIALGIFMAMIPWPGKQVVGRPLIPHMAQ